MVTRVGKIELLIFLTVTVESFLISPIHFIKTRTIYSSTGLRTSIKDVLTGEEKFTTFNNFLNTVPELNEILKLGGTIFAPSNSVFTKLDKTILVSNK